ncbi:MAG: sigma-70 family RNA polymerase sigma factor [Prevotellaceae bacterium]|nr:sigma-70 family RNA polymerase sigma factor [Candidatus Colivivens equi]
MVNFLTFTDDKLVNMYMKGDNEAFDTLLNRYESKVFSYISYTVKDNELAQDLFQDVFIRVITTIRSGHYTENGKFGSWVMCIAHNIIIDHFRTKKTENSVSYDTEDENDNDILNDSSLVSNANIETEMIDAQRLREIKSLIALLPESQREVVLMRFYQELSFKDIADITGVSINTALGRMRYALMNLRKLALTHNISLAS